MSSFQLRIASTVIGLLAASIAACAGGDAQQSDAEPVETYATFPRRGLHTVGLDSVALDEAYRRAEGLPRLHSLIVARHGDIARERYFRGPGRTGRANIKSASKSIVSALVGIAIAEGHLKGIEQPIAPFFESYLRSDTAAARKRSITVGNLLSMQSGLEPTSFGNYGEWVTSPNWVRYAITRPLVDEPGGRMLYSTGSTHMLSAILTKATGKSTFAYARDRLFRPLGIELRPWPTDPQGIYFGGNDMRLTPREMLRFGELYRNEGRYDGKQVVPADWIRDSWQPRTRSPWNGHEYGYGWWGRNARGYRVHFAWGYGGQYIFVVPELELTVVMTSDAEATTRDGGHLRALHALLSDAIIPAAEAAPERKDGVEN